MHILYIYSIHRIYSVWLYGHICMLITKNNFGWVVTHGGVWVAVLLFSRKRVWSLSRRCYDWVMLTQTSSQWAFTERATHQPQKINCSTTLLRQLCLMETLEIEKQTEKKNPTLIHAHCNSLIQTLTHTQTHKHTYMRTHTCLPVHLPLVYSLLTQV